MSFSSRCLRHSVRLLLTLGTVGALGTISPVCAAQSKPQFIQPTVESTNGRITSFVAGSFESIGLTDLLYINAATATGAGYQVTVGELLNQPSAVNLKENQITFPNVLSVSAAVADFDNDGRTDYAFALSPATASSANDLCVYYGTGLGTTPLGSYNSGKSGCTSFAIKGSLLPSFTYITAAPFKTGALAQLILEDSSNGYLYILGNSGADGTAGTLPGFTVKSTFAIPPADGAGPIYTGDFNGDGNTDFLVNNQTSHRVTLYYGNGDGTFQAPQNVAVSGNAHSILLHDMDGDGILDLVVEGDTGVIEILHGNGSNTPTPFGVGSVGGTIAGLNGFSGNGGHLALIADVNHDGILDILTTTPIGLSVLLGQGGLSYKLKGIYNIGPGRSSFALASFLVDGNLDLAVDSPQGVAIVPGKADGSFVTSLAYPAAQPGLGAAIADFNNDGKADVVVATGATQAQVLLGKGDGTFSTLPAPTAPTGSQSSVLSNLWSAVVTGDFDGDGKQDLLYSLTGLPLPTPGANAGAGLYLQYGNGDGTFQPPVPVSNQLLGAPSDNNFYGESAVADVNGDGIPDIVNLDAYYYDTLLSQTIAGSFTLGLNIQEDSGANDNTDLDSFSQVAAGVFSGTRTNRQDLVFQDDANITPYVNSGDGSHFTAMPALSNTPPVSSLYGGTILIADVDGDGCGDVVIPYHNLSSNPAAPSSGTPNQLYIWYGKCDGTFKSPVITTLSRNYYLAAIADMNADGLPDVVLSDGFVVAILYGQGNRNFGGEQDFLGGQGINSISIADVDGNGSPDIILSNGGATISDAVAIGGLASGISSIGLTPNADVDTGGITVLLNNITTKAVTGTLVSSPDPSEYQATFTMTAMLTPTAGVAAPTGTVQFSVNGTLVGAPVAVVPGATSSTATYTVPAGNGFASGIEYGVTATYSGDSLNSPITLYANQLIQGIPTTTALNLCVGPTAACASNGVISPPPPYVATLPMYYGQTFNGTAAASSSDGSVLTGFIDFNDLYNGVSSTLCQLSVAVGSACPPSVGVTQGTSVGVNVFTAVYTGDSTHAPSTSPSVTITVLQDTNAATLSGSPNPSPSGQPVTFTAVFTGNFAPPTGTVTFAETFPPTTLATPLGTATLVPSATGVTSTATLIISTLPVGTDTITVTYTATQNFAGATATTTETITPLAPSATTLTSIPNPSGIGQSVTFTATVTAGTVPGVVIPPPSGPVTFLDGGTSIGTGVLNASGAATFTTSTLAVGSHNITASYPGSVETNPSVSTVYVQVVNNSSFTITVTPSPVTVGVGNSVALTVTVNPFSGFNQGVNLSCANLPLEAACTFKASSLASGSYSTTLLLSTMAPHSCGSTQPYFTGSNGSGPIRDRAPLALPALAGLAVLFIPGRRRWLRALIAIVAVAGAMQITGCGNCTDLGTRPNTYTFQVSGASTATSEAASQSVTLVVTI